MGLVDPDSKAYLSNISGVSFAILRCHNIVFVENVTTLAYPIQCYFLRDVRVPVSRKLIQTKYSDSRFITLAEDGVSMPSPPIEVRCESIAENPNSIVVETEVYPRGYPDDDPYYINTRWAKKGGDVAFDVVEFGGKGDPGEPKLNGAAVRASAEDIEDKMNLSDVDDSSPHPDPDVGWVRVDSNGNRI